MAHEQERIEDLEHQIRLLTLQVHRVNMKAATHIAEIKMLRDMRDSWLPWWFRQGLFKVLRRHFPLTRKFLREYHINDYLSADTIHQIKAARKLNQQIERERNRREGRNNKGIKMPIKP